jgi:hypothetical protein
MHFIVQSSSEIRERSLWTNGCSKSRQPTFSKLSVSISSNFNWIYFHQEQNTNKTRNIEARSRNHCCHGKAVSITYSECVCVALVFQHAKHMRSIILPSVACLPVPYFCTFSHKRYDKNECFHFLCNVSLKWFSYKKNSARYYHKRT